jgi:CheY-like chemotaxis protein
VNSRGKVLVVDDDPVVLKITRARLEGAGFEVVTRQEALGTSQAILSELPALVLLDLNMPALAGDAIAELLSDKLHERNISIIFHSSSDLVTLQAKARASGVIGAIPKTGDDELFVAQFERLFARANRNNGGSQ